ncbi:carbohydrate ABC transporter permease [Flexivirga sp. ID2601S]|uniref:Carbohydrate ABC transporter permease n=1 Tax=Flexivirga aerilata TaxID=1656889 RepID=A0A849AFX6_9MICO|nr:carbohydrate ABC transporter permease [Flexivirga aerilata]NNG39734.1 carbohydrate ABC transporter permease [Flexivirga aerilata]
MSAVSTKTPQSDGPQEERKRERGDLGILIGSHVVLICWSLIVVLPLLWTLFSSAKTTGEIFSGPFTMPHDIIGTLKDNFSSAWNDSHLGRYLLNTVIVVGIALALVMALGSMCAYTLARFPFPGSRAIYYLILAGNTFPIFLAIVPLFFVLKNVGLLNSLPGLILTYVAFAFPFTVFFLYPFFRALPAEIGEAAELDGAGDWRTFVQVMLPMARPGIAAVTIFNFLGLWNQFLLPVALNTDEKNYVLSQGMANFASSAGYEVNFGALFAGVVITVIPVLIVYVIFQRQLQGSLSAGTMK